MININKLYETIKKYLKENTIYILGFFLLLIILNLKLPYYIEAPGGLVSLKNKIMITDKYEEKGSFNMAYVSEYRATIPMLVYAYFNDTWDILKREDIAIDDETYEEITFRDKLYLEESKQDAIICAFKKANREYKLSNIKTYITYIESAADTDLEVGDQIVSFDNKTVNSKDDLNRAIEQSKQNDKIIIKVLNGEKEYTRYASLRIEDGRKIIGVLVNEQKELITIPEIEFKFDGNESGPSGGLMMSLAIYNSLTDNDITKGLKIAGTGTIDANGNVGAIGGVKYKLIGSAKEKIDIFFIPIDNYAEAKEVVKQKSLKIKLVPIATFDEALNYLSK